MYVSLCRLGSAWINPKSVGRTVNSLAAAVQYVGVDHRGADVSVAHEESRGNPFRFGPAIGAFLMDGLKGLGNQYSKPNPCVKRHAAGLMDRTARGKRSPYCSLSRFTWEKRFPAVMAVEALTGNPAASKASPTQVLQFLNR